MQLTDHSGLRRHGPQAAQPVEIPLNGQVYYAKPEMPVASIMAAIGSPQKMEDIADELTAAGVDMADQAGLERLTTENPMLAMRLGVVGLSRAERAVLFMQECLEPESLARWAHFMQPAKPEWSEAVQREHEVGMISLPQLLAVFQDLVGMYNGGRPTEPSSPNTDGHDGTGGSSMAPVPTEVAPATPWTLPQTGS